MLKIVVLALAEDGMGGPLETDALAMRVAACVLLDWPSNTYTRASESSKKGALLTETMWI